MISNNVNKLPITNELRASVLKKFRTIHPQLQTNITPEALEKNCYDKSNNDQEAYLKFCNSLVNHRKNQLQNKQNDAAQRVNIPINQVRTGINTNLRQSLITQNSVVPSDPINALQTLAVTAGQPNQINMQPNNYRMGQPQIIQMNPSGQNFRIVPMDGYTIQQHQTQQLAQSPNPQMMPNQMQIQQMNSIRVIKKPEQIISQNPGFIDSTSSICNQMMPNSMLTNVVRPPTTRIITSSPMGASLTQQPSPQEHYTITTPVQSSIIATNNNNNNNNNSNNNNNNIQSEVLQSQPNTSSDNISTEKQPITQSTTEKPQISEEEALQVKEELTKLSGKYFNFIKLAIENPLGTPESVFKVWAVLLNVLDVSKPSDKRITLKHVAKIQDYSRKAEQHVLKHNLNAPKQLVPTVQSNEEIFGKRIIPDRSKFAFNAEPLMENITVPNNNNNSLDAAFDDIILKIKKHKPSHRMKVRNGLIKYIKEERKEFFRYLPKYLQCENEPMNSTKGPLEFDEHEFDYIDNLCVDGENIQPYKMANRSFDHNGLLRIDRNWRFCETDSFDIKSEIKLLEKEFEINQIEPQRRTEAWVSFDSEWENSTFYGIRYRNNNFPSELPSIIVRIPEDYEQSYSADWNLNYNEYQCHPNSEAHLFLETILMSLRNEFSNLSSQSWNIVPFLDIVSIYKRSIQIGLLNYECRKSIV